MVSWLRIEWLVTGWRWWLSEMWREIWNNWKCEINLFENDTQSTPISVDRFFFFCWIFQFGLIIRAFFVFIFQFSFIFSTISHSKLLFCISFHFHYQLDGRFLAQLMAAAEKRRNGQKKCLSWWNGERHEKEALVHHLLSAASHHNCSTPAQ